MLLSLTVAINSVGFWNMKSKSHALSHPSKVSGVIDTFSRNSNRGNRLKGEFLEASPDSAESSREGISENTADEMCLKDMHDLAAGGRGDGGRQCVWNHQRLRNASVLSRPAGRGKKNQGGRCRGHVLNDLFRLASLRF